MHLWRIATDTPSYVADDLSGAGAMTTGGRWNALGTAALYTSPTIARACLETLVHLAAGGLPLNRYLVRIDVPDAVWTARTRLPSPAVGWDAIPPGRVSIQAGQAWLLSDAAALLEVPSAVIPEETNIVVNPKNKDAASLTATKLRRWLYDARFRLP